MRIIAESGATKTAWRSLCDDGTVRQVRTAGLSPTGLDQEDIRCIIRDAIPSLIPSGSRVDEVFFYGAGIVSDESASMIGDELRMWCPMADICFFSDIMAAARALFGDGSGVVAIMGTGSNSCLFKDGSIVRNIRPGGYVLGDEGSGVALGRAFLADFIKGLLPEAVESDFVAEFSLTYPEIVRRVYKEPAPAAFMASLAPFVIKHADDDHVSAMIDDCLESFVKRSLSRYGCNEVGVVGSFGYACRERLAEIGGRYGLHFVKFVKSPIEELVIYHGI